MGVAACRNSPMKRCASGAVALILALSGCSWSGEADEQQLAVAKCGLPVEQELALADGQTWERSEVGVEPLGKGAYRRSEEHTSELQSRGHLVCRLLLEKKKK